MLRSDLENKINADKHATRLKTWREWKQLVNQYPDRFQIKLKKENHLTIALLFEFKNSPDNLKTFHWHHIQTLEWSVE